MLFRLFQPGDFSQLYAIEELCFLPPFRFSRAFMRKITESPHHATWIAEENAAMAGFAIVDVKASTNPLTAYIQTLEVRPSVRKRGIGSELLHRLESSAREVGARSISLHVDTENKSAIRLYEAHNYMRQGREDHFYARQRDAFIYSKSLAQPTS